MNSKITARHSYFFSLSLSLLIMVPLSSQAVESAKTDFFNAQETEQPSHGKEKNKNETQTAANEVEMEKRCAMARKNLTLLRSNKEGRSFTTTNNTLVKYSPYQLEQIIKDNETVEQESCK